MYLFNQVYISHNSVKICLLQVKVRTLEPLDALEITPSDYKTISDKEIVFDAWNITSFKILNIYIRFKNK